MPVAVDPAQPDSFSDVRMPPSGLAALLRSKRVLAIAGGAVVLLVVIIVAASGGGGDEPASSATTDAPATKPAANVTAPEPAPLPPEPAADPEPAVATSPSTTPAPAVATEPAVTEPEPAPPEPAVTTPPPVATRATPPRRTGTRKIGGKQVVVDYDTGKRETGPVPVAKEDEPLLAKARAVYMAGNKKLFAGDTAGAIASYRQSIAIYPGYVAGYRGLGLAYTQQGDKVRALKALRTYVAAAPTAKDIPLIKKRMARLQAK